MANSLDSFLKEIHKNSSFIPKVHHEKHEHDYENNNEDSVSSNSTSVPPVSTPVSLSNGRANGGVNGNGARVSRTFGSQSHSQSQSQSRKRHERVDDADFLNLDKDDDIQFVAEFLDDEPPDLADLELVPETYAPKVKRPKRAIDFDEELRLDLELLEQIDREQRDREAAAAAVTAGPSTSRFSPRLSTSAAALAREADLEIKEPEEVEIVVRYRHVLKLIPTVPHVPIACDDGSRVYLRLFPDPDKIVVNTNPNIMEQISMLNPREQTVGHVKRNLLGASLSELRRRYAEDEKNFNTIMGDLILADAKAEGTGIHSRASRKKEEEMLWVEKYKPRSYMDLLSEETINHTLLHWLKLWDNAVFGNDYINKVKQTKERYANLEAKEADRWKRVIVEDDAYDELGRPKQKVVLLYGPPGLGKTTAAHIICKHAGYNVMELNASDDRSVDIFKKALDSATGSRSEMFQDGRPTCLIIDEIDGAPLPSVQVLVDLISGKSTEAGKNKAKKILRRPIICICNELYAPSLKNLKKLALLVPFQPISVTALVDRLEDISLKENLPIDQTTMYALAEKTECDVRSCLSCIQFMKGKVTNAEEREKMLDQLGIQDKSKGIFDVWKEIFQMPDRKSKAYYGKNQLDPTRDDSRFEHILRVSQSHGEYEKLFEGVFENCLKGNFRDSFFDKILMGLEWVDWFDQIQCFIKHQQNYSLMGLLPYFFVTAHFLYAGKTFIKLQFPTNDSTSNTSRLINSTKSQITEMEPNTARFVDVSSLTLDIFPALISIIQPTTIRPVPTQLWSPKERETLKAIVEIMLSYNLTYTQERGPDGGGYIFVMDPDIEALTTFKFDDASVNKKQFAYSIKQLIAREIETEKLRRGDGGGGGDSTDIVSSSKSVQKQQPSSSKVGLPQSQVKTESQDSQMSIESQELTVTTKERKARPFNLSDYFNVKIIPKKPKDGEVDAGDKTETKPVSDIYYRFKSGYTNAVRRFVKMKDLL